MDPTNEEGGHFAAYDPAGRPQEPPPELPHVVALAVLFEGGLVLVALGLGWLCDYGPLQTFPRDRQGIIDGVWIGTVATLPMLLGLVVINRYPFGPFADLKQVVDELILPMFRGVSLPAFALISILAGLGEEMLFRGFLQGGLADVLSDRLGPAAATWCALIVASLVFGLLHPITRLYAVLCFAVGVYLGYLWIMTGNLLAPIVTHALYDFVALVYLTRGGGKRAAGNVADEDVLPATQRPSTDDPADV